MRILYTLLLFCCIIFWSSCRNDFEFEPSTGQLEFSKDTVYLDTVFTNIGSSTYNLKVYNRSDQDIRIPNVQLSQGESSSYRLNVDGVAGKVFRDVEILANDSIFVFVETTADIQELSQNALEFLYEDAILFDGGENTQRVELVTLIKDAVFLFPERDAMTGEVETLQLGTDPNGDPILIEGFFLEDNELTFTNEKPYVIYGFAAVGSNKTLTVNAGARVHFHANSGIIVADQGSMQVNGELSTDPELLENEVIFESDRLETAYSNIPGQWSTIWLTAGSTNHNFNYTTIKNGTVGLLMDSNDGGEDPTLTIRNSQIYNSSNIGLLSRTGSILGENLVIAEAGQSAMVLELGGSYEFNHSTFANYWSRSFRQTPAVVISNTFGETLAANLDRANFSNCIIYGRNDVEFGFSKADEAAFNFNFKNCLLRANDPNGNLEDDPLYNFSDMALYESVILNEQPLFLDTDTNKLQISLESPASAQGDQATANLVPLDLIGTNRTTNPDIGAYETIMFPDEN
ncbi:hypothetical protein [Croceibacter atlanticus]|uniref:hypothetical protein n=1 Tax=Croceibacter atlanticus TaxID=313588 RepID=UPI002E0F51D8|nr:hypothetical protein VVL01_12350 [Croceibacter atlanticus]